VAVLEEGQAFGGAGHSTVGVGGHCRVWRPVGCDVIRVGATFKGVSRMGTKCYVTLFAIIIPQLARLSLVVVGPVLAHLVHAAELLTFKFICDTVFFFFHLSIQVTVTILLDLTGVRSRREAGTPQLRILFTGSSQLFAVVHVRSERLVVKAAVHPLGRQYVEGVELTAFKQLTVSLT